jgi:hypothetical protein
METMLNPLFGGAVIYRDKGIMNKCYCFKPLNYVFWPLKNYKPFFTSDEFDQSGAFLLAFILISGFILHNMYSKYKPS